MGDVEEMLARKPAYLRKESDLPVCIQCGKRIAGSYRMLFAGKTPKPICKVCDDPPVRHMNTFPFVTSMFDGKPREVSSIYHLRRLEAEHGVKSAAYNMDERNIQEAPHYGIDQSRGVPMPGERGLPRGER